MTPRSAAATVAARELWARASAEASSPEAIALAADRMFLELRSGLGRWIGAEGYRALLDRALELARTEHPELGVLGRRVGDESFSAAAVRAQGPDELAAGLVQLVSIVIELLGRIIGEEMAMRLVQRAGTSGQNGVASAERKVKRNG